MTSYRRVTYEDRCQIRAFLQVKESEKSIARKLGFNKSTIYREISRNRHRLSGYLAGYANEQAVKRKKSCKRPLIISDEIEGQVLTHLFSDWSPEQIAGRLKHEKIITLCHQTIYNYIENHEVELKPYLRKFNRRGVSRISMKRHRRKGLLSIEKRPHAAQNRTRIGDWERDTMYDSSQNQVLVCTERKSRYVKIAFVKDKKVQAVTNLTNNLLKRTNKKVHTITNDNGPEFNHSKGAIAPVYYCHPGRPQERGTVENTIGLLRQYLKRKTNMAKLNYKQFQHIEDNINHRPRKCLDYKTPYEVFYGKSVALAI